MDPNMPHPSFWEAKDQCIVCDERTCTPEPGPQLMLECGCCQGAYSHVDCHERTSGQPLDLEKVSSSEFQWYCSQQCASIEAELVAMTGVKKPAKNGAGGYSVELTRHSPTLRGASGVSGLAAIAQVLGGWHWSGGRSPFLEQMVIHIAPAQEARRLWTRLSRSCILPLVR